MEFIAKIVISFYFSNLFEIFYYSFTIVFFYRILMLNLRYGKESNNRLCGFSTFGG